jgi:Arc/MetJ-type ribon-helix-helix transcriptional regulator
MSYRAVHKEVAMVPKAERVYVRVGAVLRGWLVEKAGEYGNISMVIRDVLEKAKQKERKGKP